MTTDPFGLGAVRVPGPRKPSRDDSWFTTSSGQQFFPWRPEPAKISLADVAHTLSQINRWGGHTRKPYSVAQHSVLVAGFLLTEGASRETARAGLLHDSTEAYMGGDIVSPIKRNVAALMDLESGIADAITTRFGLLRGALEQPLIKRADLIVLAWEYRELMPLTTMDTTGKAIVPEPMYSMMPFAPLDKIEPWYAAEAANAFKRMAHNLGVVEVVS